jgi:hypothetical protein
MTRKQNIPSKPAIRNGYILQWLAMLLNKLPGLLHGLLGNVEQALLAKDGQRHDSAGRNNGVIFGKRPPCARQVVKRFVEDNHVKPMFRLPCLGIVASKGVIGIAFARLKNVSRRQVKAGVGMVRQQLTQCSDTAANIEHGTKRHSISDKPGQKNKTSVIRAASDCIRVPVNDWCFHRLAIISAVSLCAILLVPSGKSAIIQSSNRIDWVVGSTVGVQGGIPVRTGTVRDVTQAPYNAPFSVDGSMPESALTAINSAISDSASNDVVYIPAGGFNITNKFTLDKAGVTIRGAGSNTVLWGAIIFGRSASGIDVYNITNSGAGVKGSTNNLVIDALTDLDGFSIAAGDMLEISSIINDVDEAPLPYISVAGYKRFLTQHVIVHSVNGHTVSITAPLVWDFTNAPVLTQKNKFGYSGAFRPKPKMGLENFTLLGTNFLTGWATPDTLIAAGCLRDSWITNVNVWYPNNYCVSVDDAVGLQIEGNNIGKAFSGGTSHAGLIVTKASGCLIQNNIIAEVQQLGMMFNDGFSGNAVFANFFTNNNANGDIICHNSHPVMNLWEANHVPVKFMMDGYFGSASHQTLFRNWFHGSIAYKRWITYMQTVGNVFGITNGYTFKWLYNETNGFTDYPIFELGFPNIGNVGYIGTTPPTSWNYPGKYVPSFYTYEEQLAGIAGYTNGIFIITNAPPYPTNVIWTNMGIGSLTNIPNPVEKGYVIKFQDQNNTNKYWPDDGSLVLPASAGTLSNATLQAAVQLSNGWTVYISGQTAYQQLQVSNKYTHLLHGNLVYTNNLPGLVWDESVADHDIPKSLLYGDTAPTWWGTNRWPAYDPTNSPYVASIPAYTRYLSGGELVIPTLHTNAISSPALMLFEGSSTMASGYLHQGAINTWTALGQSYTYGTNAALSGDTVDNHVAATGHPGFIDEFMDEISRYAPGGSGTNVYLFVQDNNEINLTNSFDHCWAALSNYCRLATNVGIKPILCTWLSWSNWTAEQKTLTTNVNNSIRTNYASIGAHDYFDAHALFAPSGETEGVWGAGDGIHLSAAGNLHWGTNMAWSFPITNAPAPATPRRKFKGIRIKQQ